MNALSIMSIPNELMPAFIWDSNPKKIMKNAALLSAVSKVFYSVVNSEEFFKGLLQLVGEDQFYLNGTSTCLKERFFEMRNFYLIKQSVEVLEDHSKTDVREQKVIYQDQMFVALQMDDRLILKILNLRHPEKRRVPLIFPCSSSCLGKEYLILSSPDCTKAVPLAKLNLNHAKVDKTASSEDIRYFFANENDFLEVVFSSKQLVFDILKVSVGKNIERTPIKEGVKMTERKNASMYDTYFHRDRLMIAYAIENEIELLSYDLLTEELTKFPSIFLPPEHRFTIPTYARFNCSTFSFISLNEEDEERRNITTFTFSKI